MSELSEALAEAVGLYLWDMPAAIEPAALTVETREVHARPAPPRAGAR